MGDVEEGGFCRWAARSKAEERLGRLVRGLTYQDGWTFTLSRGVGGPPWLMVEWELADVDDPRARTLLAGSVQFREDYGAEALRCFLFDVWALIGRLEAHERLEQLRIDGKTIWDPHPPGRPGALACAPDYGAPLPDLDRERAVT